MLASHNSKEASPVFTQALLPPSPCFLLSCKTDFSQAVVLANSENPPMAHAYVLLNVNGGTEDDVLRQVKGVSGVEEAYVSYGVYDLVIKIKANTMQELKDVVTHKIRHIADVQSSLTLLMVEE